VPREGRNVVIGREGQDGLHRRKALARNEHRLELQRPGDLDGGAPARVAVAPLNPGDVALGRPDTCRYSSLGEVQLVPASAK